MALAFLLWPKSLTAAHNPTHYENQVIQNSPGIPDVAGYVLSLEIKQVRRKKVEAPNYACNCVLWAQAQGLGVSGYGAAINYPAAWTADPPQCGFAVTKEGPYGHMIQYCRDGEWLVIDEANYRPCQITSGRRLHILDPRIKGYL